MTTIDSLNQVLSHVYVKRAQVDMMSVTLVTLLLVVPVISSSRWTTLSNNGFRFPSEVYSQPEVYIERISSFDKWAKYYAKEPVQRIVFWDDDYGR